SSSSRPARPESQPAAAPTGPSDRLADVTAAPIGSSRPGESGGTSPSPAHAIVRPDMQTSLARRQRHRRIGNGRRQRPGGTARTVALALPLFLFGTFVLVGLIGLVGAVAAYNYYSTGLPDPKQALDTLTFDQQTIVYDRTGKIELARLGANKRQVVTFSQIPPEMIDATTS